MIDLQTKNLISEVAIEEVPKELPIIGEKFLLKGIIEFIAGVADGAIGHYMSHVLRGNGYWETYDDRNSNVAKPKLNTKKLLQILFYVKSDTN